MTSIFADLDILVIADDLTGAADTGVRFCPVVGPVLLIRPADAVQVSVRNVPRGAVLNTGTRHLSAEAAALAMKEVAAMLEPKLETATPKRVFKKIDSCMRGNVGAENDVLVERLRMEASFIAPAFPAMGRTTEADVHKVDGLPVAETGMRHDPRAPVMESRLSRIVCAQSRYRIGHVGLAMLGADEYLLRHLIRGLIDGGCRHLVFDAVRQSHLDRIARIAVSDFPNVLITGSAGLAAGLTKAISFKKASPKPSKSAFHHGKTERVLFVCGSSSDVLDEQVKKLVHDHGVPQRIYPPSRLVEMSVSSAPGEREAGDVAKSGSLILRIEPVGTAGTGCDPDAVVRGLAEVAAAVDAEMKPDAIFLSGGDTAEAVLNRFGATGMWLRKELFEGVVLGEMIGGIAHRRTVITKAGAFGRHDLLSRLLFDISNG